MQRRQRDLAIVKIDNPTWESDLIEFKLLDIPSKADVHCERKLTTLRVNHI